MSRLDTSLLLPVEVDPTAASKEWWQRYHAYRRVRQMESHPDDPLWPDDQEEAHMKRDDPFKFRPHYCLDDGERVVSTLQAFAHKPGTPEYEGNKQFLKVEGAVIKDYRRHGLAKRWLPVVRQLMDNYGCTVLTVSTDEDDGHAFLSWLGAEPRITERENRLDFTKVDWPMVRAWLDEGEQRNPDTKLVLCEQRVPPEVLPEYTRALTEMINTAPMEELEHGAEVYTPKIADERYSRIEMFGGGVHAYYTRERDGAISGLTEAIYFPFEVDRIRQGFTGVGTQYRDRGLGKWIKAAMLLYLRDRHPQTTWVMTGNAGSNEPMLAINHKIGFRPHRNTVTYQISRDKLAAVLG